MADTINTLINGIESSKSDIADAIGNKGVTVPSGTKLAGMASLINQISTMHGPAESTDGNLAAFDGEGGDTLKDSGINMANVVTAVNNVSPTNGNVSLSDSNLTNDRYVRYDVNNQGLNSTQKSNARTNIGAGTSNFTGYTASDKLSTDYINNVAGWTANTGTLTSLTVGGASIATSGAATVNTINNDYNASTNKLATANDLPPTITITNTSGTKSVSDGTTTLTFGSNAFNSTSIPTAYIKSASSSGNTLTLTKQDNTTTTFTPTFTEEHLGDVVSVGATSGSHIAIGGTTANPTVGVASGYSIPSTTDQTGWSAKYDKPSGGIPATDLAESYYLASNPSGFTSNEGTVIGSGLTADYFVVGGGTVNVSISTMKPTTSSTTWSASSDVNVPTMKAISNYVTGLGYQTTDTKNTAGSTNDSSHLLYLIGAQSQAANPQTYSKDSTYINANGYLVNTNGFSSQSGASSSYASLNIGANTLSYQSGSGPAAVTATSTTHGSWTISDNTGSVYLSKTGSAVSSGNAYLLFPNVGTSSAPKTLAITDDVPTNIQNGTGTNAVREKMANATVNFSGRNAHAEALDSSLSTTLNTGASGSQSAAFGKDTMALAATSFTNGNKTVAKGEESHAEGYQSVTLGDGSHAEGAQTVAYGLQSHSEGALTQAIGDNSHAEGHDTMAGSYTDGTRTGTASHAEGVGTKIGSHTKDANQGADQSSGGGGGGGTPPEPGAFVAGEGSHAEGYTNLVVGFGSHAEGLRNYLTGNYAHIEGVNNTNSGNYSHIEGFNNINSGDVSLIAGTWNNNSGYNAFIVGHHNTNTYDNKAVVGRYNSNKSTTLLEVGNGSSGAPSNAFEVYEDGHIETNAAKIKGGIITLGNNQNTTNTLSGNGSLIFTRGESGPALFSLVSPTHGTTTFTMSSVNNGFLTLSHSGGLGGTAYLDFPSVGTSSAHKILATTDLISSAEFVEVVPYNLTVTFSESDLNYKTSINIYDGTEATGTPVYSYSGTGSSGSQTVSIESGHFFIVISGRSETWIAVNNKTGGVGTTTISGQYGSSPTISGELTADGSFTCPVQYDY